LNRWELQEAIELYEKEKSLDDQKPPARRVTLSPVFKDDLEEESEYSEEEVIRPSATRTRKRRHLCENSEDEEDENGGTTIKTLTSRKPYAAIDESSDDESDHEATPKRLSKMSSLNMSRKKYARIEPPQSKRLAKIKSPEARQKYAKLEQQAWLGGGDEEFSEDEDSDEEELEAEEGFHRSELEYHMGGGRQKGRRPDYGVPPEHPVDLTVEQKNEMLNKIEKPADRALQKLLLNEGFQFQLLPHQFLAVRKVMGVPDTFPLHVGSQVTEPEEALMSEAKIGLDSDANKCNTKGVLIADDMGLGKTVEAIAGSILRNALAAARNEPARPTIIVSPNDAVQVQWRDTLVKNGVFLEIIHMFERGQPARDFDKPIFVLMTRYTLQREVKHVFDLLEEATKNPEAEHLATSVLFPHATIDNLVALKVQYMDENSKERVDNKYREPKVESMADCVTRLVHLCTRRMQRNSTAEPVFQTLIIDESHFLKRITTFWGIGAALMATHAFRTAPLTGTPYNNGASDMATQMTFIDAAKRAAYKEWWVDATGGLQAETIRKRVAKWHLDYLVRRRKEDVLQDLVKKTVESRLISQFAAEQSVYENYESVLDPVLKEFGKLLPYQENPAVRQQLKELFTVMMALMSNMRSANIHAMLPGGREYTKQFSPTRQRLRSMEERPKSCVCCDQIMRPSIRVPECADEDKEKTNGNKRRKTRRRFRGGTANIDEMEEFREIDDDAVEMHEEEEEEELVPLPCSLCEARDGPVRHFAHEQCLETLKAARASCPRCTHAKNTTHYEIPGEEKRVYCPHIDGGFVGSSKINTVVDWYTNEVPKGDKVLILSFFKSGLDLIEGIFCHDLGIDCARFDGDLPRRDSIAELERFKKEPNCKVLFATVQSGGVGLNICEANHVAFLDRWFNPFVHQQAEDRCHRIGQTKDVNVVYFDCAATVDEVSFHWYGLCISHFFTLLTTKLVPRLLLLCRPCFV
jgi:SNF2 family DNA or RNA helicase